MPDQIQQIEAVYHTAGSCKMGVDDMAVVDPELRVHGMENLRVIDASIIPTITGSNIHGPTVMVAERTAMKKQFSILLLCTVCLLLAAGCAGRHKNQVREKLQSLSDRELITHYEMLELKMAHIDRAGDASEAGKEALQNRHRPNRCQNRLSHLHIGDEWSRLREERKLTLIEIRKRGLSPP